LLGPCLTLDFAINLNRINQIQRDHNSNHNATTCTQCACL
jgi:hypothetical protein